TRDVKSFSYHWRFGAEAGYSELSYQRPRDWVHYRTAIVNPEVACLGNNYDCLDNEQYFSRRNVYEGDKVRVGLLEVGSFGEWVWQWHGISGALGLRGDYNNYTQQFDIAPRSRVSW